MSRPGASTLRAVRARAAAGVLAVVLATASLAVLGGSEDAATGAAAPARKANVVTPGNFTGYGFDQCNAPAQWQMDRWLQSSPFLAVGIYISGDSRACRSQPNLTPAWVRTQLANGWRLLPITLGPQASCQPRFPRYENDKTIIPKPGGQGLYGPAGKQGIAEATKTVSAAKTLGIAPGSTLWYDLEGFDSKNTNCRESALSFLSGWTGEIRARGYVAGVYSSASSGILALDNARINRPASFNLPDQIWIARWDGAANTSTTYISNDGWNPHARVKQYQGGHDETWGGVKITIDRNFLDVGQGSVATPELHCGGVKIAFGIYDKLKPATPELTPPPAKVKALQCLLQEQGVYAGKVSGSYDAATIKSTNAWQAAHGFKVKPTWSTKNWMSLLTAGQTPVIKYGSTGPAVRRVQRALNAATPSTKPLMATGVFDAATTAALKAWQKRIEVEVSGVAGSETWAALAAGLH
ncbi:glycoside hydrolase domain-containing protein [Nocardioides sp. CN2-186]|uniref:glycoside hydrolase domain-containing protein n=1 Tax=Nocardioides tweenelious TaxID=3156607 RepID=UPI0032B3EBC7